MFLDNTCFVNLTKYNIVKFYSFLEMYLSFLLLQRIINRLVLLL